ncbi:ubiquitin carboxyl-terminal hydrolase 28 [Paramormyrops kingsleyae]|uniref:ubiquitinyl hydrolase 1 n=1 Tax=Paramormyrops kingsleyae TaxID=1676925 RepID=A0A3B3S7G1_9TELE|nr:ubiquitin carboxyl-terminal hydrolase 28 [Paramormyrops kingsleyae]
MRVDQYCDQGQTSANPSRILINQLREITGIHDLPVLQTALKASQGNMSQAIALLTAQVPEEEAANGEGGAWATQTNVAMSTDRPKDDLQTAIELSLQESQNSEAEERELSRALEVSAEESAARAKRKRSETPGESASPADWVRQDDWPVGVRNVGNTCWFSAVIQSLFHLPVFRRLVLNYSLTEKVLEKCKSPSDKRNVAFMQELRCLFALMVGSKRRFVDPSAAVELLRDAFRTSEAQQDVSEFTHKLLDWLEDAFQLASNANNPEDKQENPMVQLFYGTFLAERTCEGKTVSNIEQFGQYPLQVNGFNNLDECLEGAMVEGEIESLYSDRTTPSGRERWFSKLPPVLTFELSRFEFNQSLGRPEKIHKKLEFPQVIYMDRYLHKNIDLTQGRREAVRRMKEQLTVLQQKLESYKHYGSGPARYPLADMLQYVLEFATTKPSSVSPVEDVRTPLKASTGTQAGHPDPNHGEPSQSELDDTGPSDSSGSQVTTAQRTPIYKPFTQCRPPMDSPQHPAPHSISEEELHYVKSCLQRWRIEVENNINELKSSVERISQSLEAMYLDNRLCQVPYRLHAVLVHEGQASAGHYWAYVFDQSRKSWLKCNDVLVTESSWEELERDSYGGLTNASAYCLMYIDDTLPHLIAEDSDSETGQVLQGMDALPPILRRYVQEDNRWFQQELREWEEQLGREQREAPAGPEPSPEEARGCVTEVAKHEEPEPTLSQPSLLPAEHGTVDPEQSDQPGASAEDCGQDNEEEGRQFQDAEAEAEEEAEAAGENEVETEAKTGEAEAESEGAGEAQAEGGVDPEPQASPETEAPPAENQPPENQVFEVEIPSVGKILVRSDADGYNEEMMLTPAMQGIIMAIAKARQVFDKDGPEAGLIKAFHEEYSRLYQLSQEVTTPQSDPRLQHVLVYFFQNHAPNRVIERTLLEQFANRNLRYDERSISIMKEARSKLRLIKPEDMDMDEYMKWNDDYSTFLNVFLHLLTGLEQYQNGKIREALNYLVYAFRNNADLLKEGVRKGVDPTLITLYRRKCLTELNGNAIKLFASGDEMGVSEGVAIMNDAVIPCMHLMIRDNVSQEDLDVIELMRTRWCSYLGQDMDGPLQEKLVEFLPRMLDCSVDRVVLTEPPQVLPGVPHDLCSRLAAVMESIHGTSVVTVT